jgi:hypothetical protein
MTAPTHAPPGNDDSHCRSMSALTIGDARECSSSGAGARRTGARALASRAKASAGTRRGLLAGRMDAGRTGSLLLATGTTLVMSSRAARRRRGGDPRVHQPTRRARGGPRPHHLESARRGSARRPSAASALRPSTRTTARHPWRAANNEPSSVIPSLGAPLGSPPPEHHPFLLQRDATPRVGAAPCRGALPLAGVGWREPSPLLLWQGTSAIEFHARRQAEGRHGSSAGSACGCDTRGRMLPRMPGASRAACSSVRMERRAGRAHPVVGRYNC